MAYGGITPTAPKPTSTTGGYSGIAPAQPSQPAPTTPAPLSGLGYVAKPLVSAAQGAVSGYQGVQSTPKDMNVIGSTIDAFSNAIKQGSQNLTDNFGTMVNQINNTGTLGLKGDVALGKIGIGAVNTIFGALLSPLQGIAHVPVVGNAVDVVNKIFSAVGEGSGQGAVQVLNETPLSQSTKDTLAPLVHDAASLVAQIYAGKVGGDTLGALKDKATAITDTLHSQIQGAKTAIETGQVKDLPVQGASTEQPVPFANDYRAPQETIQMGVKPKDTLPTAASSPVEAPSTLPQIPGLKYEPTTTETTPQTAPTASLNAETTNVPTQQETTSIEANVAPRAQKTGEVTKAATDINDTMVKQGYEALPPELQSKYTPISYKDELVKSVDLVKNNYEDAVARVAGSKPLGKYEGQILFNEVERVANANGDYETQLKLASSPLGKKLSVAGQTMGAHGFNDNPNSPVDAIREIQDARRAVAEKTLTKQGTSLDKEAVRSVKEGTTEVRRAASTPQVWDTFIKSITCGY